MMTLWKLGGLTVKVIIVCAGDITTGGLPLQNTGHDSTKRDQMVALVVFWKRAVHIQPCSLLFSITDAPRCVPRVRGGGGKVHLFFLYGFTLVIYNFFNPHNSICMNRKVTFAYVTWHEGLAALCCISYSGYVRRRVLLCQEKRNKYYCVSSPNRHWIPRHSWHRLVYSM